MLLTGGLEAWVRTLPSFDPTSHFKLTMTLEKHDQTDKVQKLLVGWSIPVTVKRNVQQVRFIKKGCRVVYQNDADMVKAVLKGLKQSHEGGALVTRKAGSDPGTTVDTTEIQYGGIYPTSQAAQVAQHRLEGKTGYVFKIVDGYRKVGGKVDTLEVPALTTPDLERCKQSFKDMKIPDSAFQVEHV